MLITEPTKRRTLTLCKIIEEDFRYDPKIQYLCKKLEVKVRRWDRRNNMKNG